MCVISPTFADNPSKTDSCPQVFITNRACAFLAILADALLLAITWRVLAPSGQRGDSLRSKGLVYIMMRDGLSNVHSSVPIQANATCFQERSTSCE